MSAPTKICSKCKTEKPRTEFYPRSSGSTNAGQTNSECKECHKERSLRNVRKRRDAVYQRLGGKCYCCGESIRMLLTIDHKNDDGAEHRREIAANHVTPTKGSANLAQWLYGRPEEDHRFQIACWNCNAGRHLNGGVCPHQTKGEPDGSQA